MKVQVLLTCEYDEFRFTPTIDPFERLTGNNLVQTDHDRLMFSNMIKEYSADPNHFSVKMKYVKSHPELTELAKWMEAKTPTLSESSFEYKFRHRLVWIVNGLTDFPKCPVCGKKIGFEDNSSCWATTCRLKEAKAWNYKTHCCKLHAEQDPEHQKLVEAGVMASLGVTHPTKDPVIMAKLFEKQKTTYRERTGYDTHFENPEYQKENADRIRRYWNDPEKHAEIARKSNATKMAKTNEEKADIERRRQESRIRSFGSANYGWGDRFYEYEGMQFDSSWELYVWIWFREHGHNIRRAQIRLEYEFENKIHGYYPDFVIDDKLTEIKGDHFFSVKGDPTSPMLYPYFREKKTPEQLVKLDGQIQAKQECMRANGVTVLTWKDVKPMKQYVETKYGKGWARAFRKKKKKENE